MYKRSFHLGYKVAGFFSLLAGFSAAFTVLGSGSILFHKTYTYRFENVITFGLSSLLMLMFFYGGLKMLKYRKVGRYFCGIASAVVLVLIAPLLFRVTEWDFPEDFLFGGVIIAYFLTILLLCVFIKEENELQTAQNQDLVDIIAEATKGNSHRT